MAARITVLADPRFIEFEDWAILAIRLTGLGVEIPRPYGMPWQQWAAFFIDVPELRRYALPNPYSFQDWKDWAYSVILVSRAGV